MIPRSRLSRYGSRSFAVCGPIQLAALYQQPFETYLHHHHPVSAVISKLNFFAGRMVLIHHCTYYLTYLFTCLLCPGQ